jgi:hypothetical protein
VSPSCPPLRPAAGLVGLALLVAACGADDADSATSADARLEPEVAAALADQADRVADHLGAGEDCDALDEAELLYAAAREGAADGTVPEEVAREVEDVTAAVTRDLDCDAQEAEPAEEAEPEPAEEAEPEPADEAEPEPADDGGNGGGGGNEGKGKGNNGKGKG